MDRLSEIARERATIAGGFFPLGEREIESQAGFFPRGRVMKDEVWRARSGIDRKQRLHVN